MDSLLIVGVCTYVCVFMCRNVWGQGLLLQMHSEWEIDLVSILNSFFTHHISIFYDMYALDSCLSLSYRQSLSRPLVLTKGVFAHSLAPSWQYRQKASQSPERQTERKWEEGGETEKEINTSNMIETELERKGRGWCIARKKVKMLSFNLRPLTVSEQTAPLWRTQPQLPAVNQKLRVFCVCVSLRPLAICPVFPSHDQHYWNSFRLGSHFTGLPKKASLLWLSLCVGVLLRSRGALFPVNQP